MRMRNIVSGICLGLIGLLAGCVVIPFGAVIPSKSKLAKPDGKDKWSTETQIYETATNNGSPLEIKVSFSSEVKHEGKQFRYIYSVQNLAKDPIRVKWESVSSLPRPDKSDLTLNAGSRLDFEVSSSSEPSLIEKDVSFYTPAGQEKLFITKSKAPAYVP